MSQDLNSNTSTPTGSPQGPESKTIQNLFSNISESYDSANDLITFGIARLWRKKLVKWSLIKKTDFVLDIATGTGDLAFDFYKAQGQVANQIVGADFCEPMLEIARKKAKAQKADIQFQFADACALPFEDESFDIVSISYGLRNVENLEKAVGEMFRVLKPRGRMMILETGSESRGVLGPFVKFYNNRVMPILGGMISGKKEAYNYLSKSSSKFPSGEALIQRIQATAAFEKVECQALMGGASFLYRAIK